jgi:Helix-turn-helix domain
MMLDTTCDPCAHAHGHTPAPGTLPKRLDTVLADVLAKLLAGEQLTPLETVRSASTTRLAAQVHCLKAHYGWPIQVELRAAGCQDGRVAYVARYWLSPSVRAQALAKGAAPWLALVVGERARLRKRTPQAYASARRSNEERDARREAQLAQAARTQAAQK